MYRLSNNFETDFEQIVGQTRLKDFILYFIITY